MQSKWYIRLGRFIKNNWKALIAGVGAVLAAIIAVLTQKTREEANRVVTDGDAEKDIATLDDKKEIEKLKREAKLERDVVKREERIKEIEEAEKIEDKKKRMERLAELGNR